MTSAQGCLGGTGQPFTDLNGRIPPVRTLLQLSFSIMVKWSNSYYQEYRGSCTPEATVGPYGMGLTWAPELRCRLRVSAVRKRLHNPARMYGVHTPPPHYEVLPVGAPFVNVRLMTNTVLPSAFHTSIFHFSCPRALSLSF